MKRPLALIGITYFISLTFLNFIPNEFVNCLAYVFAMLFFICVYFKKLRKTWTLPICFIVCLTSVIVRINNISQIKNIEKLSEQECTVCGKIYDIPYKQENLYEYILRLDSVNEAKVNPFIVSLKSNSPLEGEIYSKFTGKIKFDLIPSDSKLYYNSKNIFILGNLSKNKSYKIEEPSDKNWYYHVLKLKEKIIKKLFLNPNISGVINAILVGEKNDLPKNIKKDFQKIGVYHLLATSGMHVAIISQFIFYIFKKLKIKERKSALFSSLSMLLFMAVAGFTPSVTRASVMAIIYFLGIYIYRNSDSLNSLGIAVLIICLLNPFAACDVSLWLSFLATLGIILCYNPIKNYIYIKIKNKKSVALNYIISTLSITLCAFIFTLPIVILKFKKISLIAPISNLIFIPGINIIINLSLILNALKIANVPNVILEPMAIICGHVTNSLVKASELLANIPYVSISINYSETYVWLIITMVIVALAIMIKPTKKAFITTALISINIALLCTLSHQIFNYNKLDVSLIYCKNGICAMLSKNNHLAVILCVSDDSNIENISDALSDSYIKNIDYLNLNIEKNIDTNRKSIENLIYKHPSHSTVLNEDSPITLGKIKDYKLILYKSYAQTDFWKDISVKNLKIGNHTYIKIDTPNANFILFPNGGDAEKLPNDWKKCKILIANGLPINYLCINFEKAIISSNSKKSSINSQKITKIKKDVMSLFDCGEIHIKLNPDGNYKPRRLS